MKTTTLSNYQFAPSRILIQVVIVIVIFIDHMHRYEITNTYINESVISTENTKRTEQVERRVVTKEIKDQT